MVLFVRGDSHLLTEFLIFVEDYNFESIGFINLKFLIDNNNTKTHIIKTDNYQDDILLNYIFSVNIYNLFEI